MEKSDVAKLYKNKYFIITLDVFNKIKVIVKLNSYKNLVQRYNYFIYGEINCDLLYLIINDKIIKSDKKNIIIDLNKIKKINSILVIKINKAEFNSPLNIKKKVKLTGIANKHIRYNIANNITQKLDYILFFNTNNIQLVKTCVIKKTYSQDCVNISYIEKFH